MNNSRQRKKISETTRVTLWAKAAGRCEMKGCNKLLYESSVTYDNVKTGEVAHNIGVSEKGPRGEIRPFWISDASVHNEVDYNEIDNLLLLCPECHAEVDKNCEKYPVELLRKMKKEHEDRVRNLTSITEDRKCLLISFAASIGKNALNLSEGQMLLSLSDSHYFAAPEDRIDISQLDIPDSECVSVQKMLLKKNFESLVEPRLKKYSNPIAVFAFAPIPLLILFGSLFPTGTRMFVFQKLRNPLDREWYWKPEESKEQTFKLISPNNPNPNHMPCLALEGTAIISAKRIIDATRDIEGEIDIWRIQAIKCRYDLLCKEGVLREWNSLILQVINEIRTCYGHHRAVRIFPAINNALAVATGSARLDKTDSEWIIYDNVKNKDAESNFMQSISIGGKN